MAIVSDLFELTPPASSAAIEQLNPQQRAAVAHGEGPLLVVAGAGTGKTRVITERIRHLLESNPELPGESIVGLTFTEKAAAEMKGRVSRTAGERGRDVFLGTFHGFCNALLLERNPKLQTVEDVDHWILLRRNLSTLALDYYRRLAEPGQFLGDFVKFFSRCQDELVSPEEYERYVEGLAGGYAEERSALPEDEQHLREEEIARQREIARAYRASDRLLRERNRLTFGMQLLDAVRALDEDAALADTLRERYRYILVDEFQDTNVAQIELLWRLAAGHRNIVAVGDNAQAIYRFRGASFGSFTIFLERFAGIPRGDRAAAMPFIQPLVDNYRSAGRVLRVSGQVASFIEHSPLVPKKELVAHKPEGEKVRIVEFGSAADEGRWIAAEIERLHGAGQRWRNFAALYRIHHHRFELVEALEERGIPFVIRNLTILNHPLVRDLLAYLRLLARPSDNVACARVLAAPAWGFEPSDLVRLCERAAKAKTSLWDALQSAQGELPFSGQPRQTGELVAGMTGLRKRASRLTAEALFDALAEWLDLFVVVSEADRRYVDRLATFIREWQPKSETSRLAELVEYLDYFAQAGGQINLEQDAGEDAVQLMTVHAAKGLEFEHVFVLRLTHRGFPMASRTSVLEFPEKLMKEELPKGDFHVQEERRLFYVALTRAKERLTLTTVLHKRSKPSVFLDDILSSPQLARQHVQRLVPGAASLEPPPRLPASTFLFPEARLRARVYSRIGEWAETYRPPVFEPLRLSASAVDSYRNCPQKYLFGAVWGIPGGPRAATTFGNVMHTTIKQFIEALRKGRRLEFEEVETIFRREWSSAGFEDTYQEECYQGDGLEQLRAFYTSYMESPADVIAQEKRFALELENNVQITGRIDQINRLGPGEVEVVDYKTGRPKTATHARNDLQLGIYALAAREDLELEPARLIYYNLETNECVAATRDAKQIEETRGTIQEVAGDIRAREFPALPGFQCRSCEYRFICPAQEPRRGPADADAAPEPVPATATSAKNPASTSEAGVATQRSFF
jgi:DNA helicase-2/ATP-dependent DNA helicase PcrA